MVDIRSHQIMRYLGPFVHQYATYVSVTNTSGGPAPVGHKNVSLGSFSSKYFQIRNSLHKLCHNLQLFESKTMLHQITRHTYDFRMRLVFGRKCKQQKGGHYIAFVALLALV